MIKYKLYWREMDRTEIVEGANIIDAFRRAGYSAGAVHALDWFEEIEEEQTDEKQS